MHRKILGLKNKMEEYDCFDVEKGLALEWLERENEDMPSHTYFQTLSNPTHHHHLSTLRRRRLLLSSVLHFQMPRRSTYLALNYMDRFLSLHPFTLPDGKPWILELVAVSCVSLAMKMTSNTQFSLSQFRHDRGIGFDSATVQRMEMLILTALKWRMRSINPFSFVALFLSFFHVEDPKSVHELKGITAHIIFKAQHEIMLLQFKPSVVAASALLSAAHRLFPLHLSTFTHSIFNSGYINKEDLLKCLNTMQHLVEMDGQDLHLPTTSNPYTPPDVLDLARFSASTSGSKRKREISVCINKEVGIQKHLPFYQ